MISSTNTDVIDSEGLLIGYRWYDGKQIQPLFPFGFGLSYTTLSYSGMSASADGGGNVTVTFTVTRAHVPARKWHRSMRPCQPDLASRLND